MTTPYTLNTPTYALDMLWWVADDFQHMVELSQGELSIPPAIQNLRLCWGTPQGSPMQTWQNLPEELAWNGAVAVHGHVESAHITSWQGEEWLVIELSGRLLPSTWRMLPRLLDLQSAPYQPRISIDLAETLHWYAFLMPLDSPFIDFVHHALINGYAVECYGGLAGQKSQLQNLLGLPLVLDQMTLHSSR